MTIGGDKIRQGFVFSRDFQAVFHYSDVHDRRLKIGAAKGRRCGKPLVHDIGDGLDLLRRQGLKRSLLFTPDTGQFRRNGFPAGLMLLHPPLKPFVKLKNALFDGLIEPGFGLFNIFQLDFKFLGLLPILAAMPVHMPAVGIDHVAYILRRVYLLPESIEDQAVQNIHPVGSRFAGFVAFAHAIGTFVIAVLFPLSGSHGDHRRAAAITFEQSRKQIR